MALDWLAREAHLQFTSLWAPPECYAWQCRLLLHLPLLHLFPQAALPASLMLHFSKEMQDFWLGRDLCLKLHIGGGKEKLWQVRSACSARMRI